MTTRLQSHQPNVYPDGRSAAARRMPVRDVGRVFRHGLGPDDCDRFGAREASVVAHDGNYFLYYDGAGPRGWLACLAVSTDLTHWRRLGPVLDFGLPGSPDSATATSPWLVRDGGLWHMFYLGSPHASPAPDFVPQFPYLTLKATAPSPAGPWTKHYGVRPFTTAADTFRASTASPGFVVRHGDEYLQYFSGSVESDFRDGGAWAMRTLGIAFTRDLNGSWTVESEPVLPPGEQIENSSVYYEPANDTWFLFTNHVGCEIVNGTLVEYTDAVWVYWSRDPRNWDPENKAVVVDGCSCSWADKCIGMPSVVPVGNQLAVLYDSPGGDSAGHMGRDIGLAWLDLPLRPPDA